jgi:oligoendopeptidase F
MEDPYWPTAPTLIKRRFDIDREIPEARVKAMFEQVLSSPLVPRIAKLIESRLGRPLEPFDIWYNGFRQRGPYTQAQLDEIVSKKYPTAAAFENDIPNLLTRLGFTRERAVYLANNIVVDPARGSGHAWGAQMRSEKTHLRTRVAEGGMDYKGYNIAIHEMGHNVEQTFSLNDVDHTLLEGVPNTAFTEALAFVFQARDLELLGLAQPDAKSEAMKTLDDFWKTNEIVAVALVDMEVWHWMYENPNATPAELKEATLRISKRTWNEYFAPVFRKKDVVLLGIYSHMIHSFLYLPDYPIGHMIAHQIEEQVKKTGAIGSEFERMATFGNVTPDLWMRNATGESVGPEALLEATKSALEELGGENTNGKNQ